MAWGTSEKPSFFIGIDPGVATGFAVYSPAKRRIIECRTISFWDTITELEFYRLNPATIGRIVVVIEDPNLNPPTFIKRGATAGEVKKREKISQNVGQNKRDAQLIIEYCQRYGLEVKPRKPGKGTGSKIPADSFQTITAYAGSTSQHARDAAMLVWGM